MSSQREDTIFEIFSFIRSSNKIKEIWDNKIKKIKDKHEYIEPYELYCLAFKETKKELLKIEDKQL
jgi:hypothetical protein